MSKLSSLSGGVVRFFKKVFWRKSVALLLIVLIGGGGYFYYNFSKNGTVALSYVTAAVTKGTLVVSVTGSGQVSVDSEVEVKAKVSGQLSKLNVKNGQAVKSGDVIAVVDDAEGEKAVRDAKINLENAQIALQKLNESVSEFDVTQAKSALEQAKMDLADLQEPPTASELLNADNSVAAAKRELQQAKDNYEKVGLDAEQELDKAYDDGYTAVTSAFLEVPDLVKDAYMVQWDGNDDPSDHVYSYKLILGQSSPYITAMVSDYNDANTVFKASFTDYEEGSRDDDRDKAYALIDETYTMVRAVADALESAKNVLDLIVNADYQGYFIADTVDKLRTIMQEDITVINKHVSALSSARDTIDTTTQNLPFNVSSAQASIDSAEEKLKESENALDELKDGATEKEIYDAKAKVAEAQNTLDELVSGADSLDIKAQNLTIEQRNNDLADAQSDIADYDIRAPFDGIISAVNVAVGDTISASSIANLISNQMLAEVSLNEVDMVKLAVGQKATLTFDAVEELTITGEVVEIDTVGTVSSGVVTYGVKVAFDTDDERIRPGMSVDAAIITDTSLDVLLVPNSAVKSQGDISYVEVLASADSTTPTQQEVEVGLSDDSSTEIVNGVKEGDLVVTKTKSGASSGAALSGSTKTSTATSSSGGSGMGIMGISGGGGPPPD